MARFRRRRFSRRTRRTRRRPRAVTLKSIARNAAKGLIKYYLNPEYKFVDNLANNVSIPNAPTASLLTGIAQGDDQSTRDGYSVKITNLNFHADVQINAAATGPQIVRIMLLFMNENNGAAPTMSRIFADPTNIRSPYNLLFKDEFKMLYDKTMALSTDYPKRVLKWNFKPHTHAKFSGTTSATASITTGHYWLLIWGDAGANTPAISYYHRVRYLDN